jgi:hypothetical protein
MAGSFISGSKIACHLVLRPAKLQLLALSFYCYADNTIYPNVEGVQVLRLWQTPCILVNADAIGLLSMIQ